MREWPEGEGPAYVKDPGWAMMVGEACVVHRMTHEEAGEKFATSAIVVRGCIAFYWGVLQGRASTHVDFNTLPGNVQAKVTATIKRLEADRNIDVMLEVAKWKEEFFIPKLEEKLATLTARLNNRNGLMTAAQHKGILACLHPDSNMSAEKKAPLFDLFKQLDLELMDEKEFPVTSTLPTSLAELMARRKKK